MFSLDLGFWKFRNLLETPNEIIQRISMREMPPINDLKSGWEALVYLNPKLLDTHYREQVVYGSAAGSGRDTKKYSAIFKAISEALERWAFFETIKTNELGKYGFDLDCSTNGMAAYPGILKASARTNARNEAIERWRLFAWWNGHISSRALRLENTDLGVIELYDQFFGEKTVIVYSCSNYTSYGFATDFSIERAMKKAQIEQVRNSGILSEYTNKKSDICSLQENRLLFFSTVAGFELFKKKIDATRFRTNSSPVAVAPELIIDSEIFGPWSKYATVWRCLFDHFNFEQNNNSTNIDLFYF